MTPENTDGKAGIGLSPAIWRPIADFLAFCLVILAIAWALNVPRMLNVGFYPAQFLAGTLALALPLAFLTLPARSGSERTVLPWYDAIFALAALASLGFITFAYPYVVNFIFSKPPSAWIPGLIVVLLLLEALRRSAGWTLVIIIAVFLLYALFADAVPGRMPAGRRTGACSQATWPSTPTAFSAFRSPSRQRSLRPSSCSATCLPSPADPISSPTRR